MLPKTLRASLTSPPRRRNGGRRNLINKNAQGKEVGGGPYPLARRLSQHTVLGFGDHLADQGQQPLDAERFQQVAIAARLDGVEMAGVAGHEDDAASGRARDLRQNEAVIRARQGHVDERGVKTVFRQGRPHLLAAGDDGDVIALVIEQGLQEIADAVIVLDDQNLADARHALPLAGNWTKVRAVHAPYIAAGPAMHAPMNRGNPR